MQHATEAILREGQQAFDVVPIRRLANSQEADRWLVVPGSSASESGLQSEGSHFCMTVARGNNQSVFNYLELLTDERSTSFSLLDVYTPNPASLIFLQPYRPSVMLSSLTRAQPLFAGQTATLLLAILSLRQRLAQMGLIFSGNVAPHLRVDDIGSLAVDFGCPIVAAPADCDSAHPTSHASDFYANLISDLRQHSELDAFRALEPKIVELFEYDDSEEFLEAAIHLVSQQVTPAKISLQDLKLSKYPSLPRKHLLRDDSSPGSRTSLHLPRLRFGDRRRALNTQPNG